MKTTPVLVWFRQDLRLKDNPALTHACQTGLPIIPLYILDDCTVEKWKMGEASREWLCNSLASLDASLRKKGARLFFLQGNPLEILPEIVKKYGVIALFWNRCYEPFAIKRDKKLERLLPNVNHFKGSLLFEPWEVLNQQDGFFKIFSPFWKRCLEKAASIPPPLPEPKRIKLFPIPLKGPPSSEGQLHKLWQIGESGAHQKLKHFIKKSLPHYAQKRDRIDFDKTSKLSPHLHFGEISPRQIYHEVKGYKKFLSELGWREFSSYQLFHYPKLPEKPWKEEFGNFPWKRSSALLKKWQTGETGYPIVDAAMRQLWEVGWIHNRARMIVASFLIKDLFIHWTKGESWFWNTLVDADLANNAASWQWAAGSGFDSAPFFRIFNPTVQGEKFDPEGTYTKRWVPELSKVPKSMLQRPLDFDPHLPYPPPIVDHQQARSMALDAFRKLKTERKI
ncbi:MAG: deoxyribodipyrimidine photo-lyase [Chlamydiales bacterium]